MGSAEKARAIFQVNFSKIFSRAWPESMFANSLMLKLNTRALYEIPSIATSSGAMTSGDPCGRNKLNSVHCFEKLMSRMTIRKNVTALSKLTANALLGVNAPGNSP